MKKDQKFVRKGILFLRRTNKLFKIFQLPSFFQSLELPFLLKESIKELFVVITSSISFIALNKIIIDYFKKKDYDVFWIWESPKAIYLIFFAMIGTSILKGYLIFDEYRSSVRQSSSETAALLQQIELNIIKIIEYNKANIVLTTNRETRELLKMTKETVEQLRPTHETMISQHGVNKSQTKLFSWLEAQVNSAEEEMNRGWSPTTLFHSIPQILKNLSAYLDKNSFNVNFHFSDVKDIGLDPTMFGQYEGNIFVNFPFLGLYKHILVQFVHSLIKLGRSSPTWGFGSQFVPKEGLLAVIEEGLQTSFLFRELYQALEQTPIIDGVFAVNTDLVNQRLDIKALFGALVLSNDGIGGKTENIVMTICIKYSRDVEVLFPQIKSIDVYFDRVEKEAKGVTKKEVFENILGTGSIVDISEVIRIEE